MNPIWLARNIATAWRRRLNVAEFVRRLIWLYSPRVKGSATEREWTIGFCYPAPVGKIWLTLRGNGGADAFIHSEVFEHRYYHLPLTTPPATILDLGANIGLSAIYLKRRFPDAQLACVEPVPENLRLLRQNLERNAIDATVFAGAVDVNDGQAIIELAEKDYAHRVIPAQQLSPRPRLAVAAVSVPALYRRLGWDRIGLLKVDIEGHEKVLFSANCDWMLRVDVMCIEWHDDDGAARSSLRDIAERFDFAELRQLPGIWLMSRSGCAGRAAAHTTARPVIAAATAPRASGG